MKNINYYVYSYTIARSDGVKAEIKNHKTNAWSEVVDPLFWRRIQLEGDLVTQDTAEELYQIYHREIYKTP